MSATTAIEWTEASWNPTTGCDRISPGCDNCYAARLAKRLKAMGSAKYQTDGDPRTSGPGFGVAVHEAALTEPLRWRTPRTVFVNSMSDLAHAQVSTAALTRVFAVMALATQHTFQVLTKRPRRLARLLEDQCRCGSGHVPGVHFRSAMSWAVSTTNPDRVASVPDDAEHRVYHRSPWPLPNVWIGASIETDDYRWRADQLRATPAAVRFLSCEPLLGPLPDLDLTGIGWVIAGGESGPGARPVNPQWIRDIRDACQRHTVPFFFKQWGGRGAKAGGRELDGRTWDQYPDMPAGTGVTR
jgi:protein gp37